MRIRFKHLAQTGLMIALAYAGTAHADSVQARLPQPGSARCEFVRGYCVIHIQDPIARQIASTQVLPSGPGKGWVTPQVYADAVAGRAVVITKISFTPNGQGMQATIAWQ